MLTFGSLFSGIGGMDLGLERAGMRAMWQCEKDPYALKVLEKHWPDVRRYDDITTLDAAALAPVDLICGGFPCQPFSVAGKRKGAGDDRFLWPAMLKVIETVRPTWVLGENVPGLISLGLDGVLSDLEGLGYAVRAFVVPACAVGALHRRDRLWVLGNSECQRGQGGEIHHRHNHQALLGGQTDTPCAAGKGPETLAHSYSAGLEVWEGQETERAWSLSGSESFGSRGWTSEPVIRRGVDVVSNRVDRLKCLGNSVVPAVVEEFGRMIVAAHHSCNP